MKSQITEKCDNSGDIWAVDVTFRYGESLHLLYIDDHLWID